MQDRRKYPRYSIKLPLYFQFLDPQGEKTRRYGEYWTKDVSLGGICFGTREDLKKGTPLILELHLPKESFSALVTQDPMRLQGRVIWCGKIPVEGGMKEVGVEFLAILEHEQKRIEECINFLLEQGAWDH